MLRMAVSCLCLLGGLARGAGAQAARTGPDAATFDLQDRRAQNLLVALRCAQRVSELRAQGRFGPADSLGRSGHCLRTGGEWVGVFLDTDSTGTRLVRASSVSLRDGARLPATPDTASLLARQRATRAALDRGYPAYVEAERQFGPVTLHPEPDSLQVWLVPVEVLAGRALGGERGYLFRPDGTGAPEEVDAFASYRPFSVPDTGTVTIESREEEIPLLSEMVMANLVNERGRPVMIATRMFVSTLVGAASGAVWLHHPRPPR